MLPIDAYQPLYVDPIESGAFNSTKEYALGIVNTASDGLMIVIVFLLFALSIFLFITKKGWQLIHSLLCYRTYRYIRHKKEQSESRWQQKQSQRKWMLLLMSLLPVFLAFRLLHEVISLAQHASLLAGQVFLAESVFKQIRRILDYAAIEAYFALFTFVVPMWCNSALIWVSLDRTSKKRRAISAVVFVAMCILHVLFFVAMAPMYVISFIQLCRPDLTLDGIRRTLMYAITAPLGVIVVVSVLLFVAMFGGMTLKLVRGSPLLKQHANEKAVQQQKQSILKLSVGMVIFTLCVLIRVVGVVLYAINGIPDFVVYVLTRTFPDALFVLALALLFWPYNLPLIGGSIKITFDYDKFHNLSSIVDSVIPGAKQRRALVDASEASNVSSVSVGRVDQIIKQQSESADQHSPSYAVTPSSAFSTPTSESQTSAEASV